MEFFKLTKFISAVVSLVLISSCASFSDKVLNRARLKPPYEPTTKAAEVHKGLFVIDLHGDFLLWNRDLLKRGSQGHVDLLRLQEGNVAIQVFGLVTGVPFPTKIDNNRDHPDIISTLVRQQGWPEATHDSRLNRALFQIDKLKERIQASNGALKLILNQRDLEELIAIRAAGESMIGAMLGLEGAHALEGDPDNVNKLFSSGVRILGLLHHFDNDMAGSAQGVDKYGLTDKGREVLQMALAKNMIIDLAHASPQTIDDVLAVVDRPVVVSHGGVRGTCDTARNLSDHHIRGIANTGGVIGIGLFHYATCGKTLGDTVKAMRYVADLVGAEYVALGSDFDGAVATVVDASGLVMLTQALLEDGFTEQEVAGIMGGNALRVLQKTLPTE